ncbi:hypothetical protein SESBI_14116 [Sesbania bispinosa]|nr:hypothetical protein SESBI_14116 [Sesbania bispinosa]
MGELVGPLRTLLKGKDAFVWTGDQQKTIKQVIASVPVMSPPEYIAVIEQAINGLIAQKVEGRERPICYASRVLKEVEARYPRQEHYCLNRKGKRKATLKKEQETEEGRLFKVHRKDTKTAKSTANSILKFCVHNS